MILNDVGLKTRAPKKPGQWRGQVGQGGREVWPWDVGQDCDHPTKLRPCLKRRWRLSGYEKAICQIELQVAGRPAFVLLLAWQKCKPELTTLPVWTDFSAGPSLSSRESRVPRARRFAIISYQQTVLVIPFNVASIRHLQIVSTNVLLLSVQLCIMFFAWLSKIVVATKCCLSSHPNRFWHCDTRFYPI